MTTHTPGPWRTFRQDRYYVQQDDSPRLVADCGASHGPAAESNRANARLIAAAPELLAFVRDTLARLDEMTSEEFSRGGDLPIRLSGIRLGGKLLLERLESTAQPAPPPAAAPASPAAAVPASRSRRR